MAIRVSLCQTGVFRGLLFLLLLAVAAFVDVDADLEPVTSNERKVIDKFRKMIEPMLTKDYMHSDAWLVTWLRSKKMNLNDARAMLEKSMEWRKRNNMDNFLQEDWSKFDREYGSVVHQCGVGRAGQIIGYARWGRADIRKAILAGQSTQFVKYMAYHLWEAPQIAQYEASLSAGSGQRNATVGVGTVVDLTGFSLRKHICLGCLAVQVEMAVAYEKGFPRLWDPFIAVNIPAAFDVVINALRAVFTPHTNKHLQVYRNGRELWGKVVDKHISIDQLPRYLGGRMQCS